MSIPPPISSGRKPKHPKTKYKWESMKKGDARSGTSRESLISAFRSFFGTRKPNARFTTRKEEDGTFTIYRTK